MVCRECRRKSVYCHIATESHVPRSIDVCRIARTKPCGNLIWIKSCPRGDDHCFVFLCFQIGRGWSGINRAHFSCVRWQALDSCYDHQFHDSWLAVTCSQLTLYGPACARIKRKALRESRMMSGSRIIRVGKDPVPLDIKMTKLCEKARQYIA